MTLDATCACGQVRLEARGAPIVAAACYCDDCQAGARRIEALPGAPAVMDADGGTPLLVYRDDRIACVAGAHLLEAVRLKPRSRTRRMVATCCNSAMFLKFEPGHWVSAYRKRFGDDAPPVTLRTQVQHRSSDLAYPDDAPRFAKFPLRLFWLLIRSRLAMMIGR